MKKDIHPKFYKDAKIICSCGQTWKLGSTKQEVHVELCSNCHPFYTGQDKLVDTAGKVEKFQARAAKTEAMKSKKGKSAARRTKKAIKSKKKKKSDK